MVRRENGGAGVSLDLGGLGKEVDQEASLATVIKLGKRIKSQEVIQVTVKVREVKKTGPIYLIKKDPRGREINQRAEADLKENTRKNLKVGQDQNPTLVKTRRVGRVTEIKSY